MRGTSCFVKLSAKTATLFDGLIPIKLDGKVKPRVVHWSGKLPDFAKHLHTWGEAGTVKTKTPTTAKLADCSVHCMFVGYALDHAGDAYHMWNPKTGWVHEMRNVIWLHHMYFEKPGTLRKSSGFGIFAKIFSKNTVIPSREIPSFCEAPQWFWVIIAKFRCIQVSLGDPKNQIWLFG
jgi:hypothetical protein